MRLSRHMVSRKFRKQKNLSCPILTRPLFERMNLTYHLQSLRTTVCSRCSQSGNSEMVVVIHICTYSNLLMEQINPSVTTVLSMKTSTPLNSLNEPQTEASFLKASKHRCTRSPKTKRVVKRTKTVILQDTRVRTHR